MYVQWFLCCFVDNVVSSSALGGLCGKRQKKTSHLAPTSLRRQVLQSGGTNLLCFCANHQTSLQCIPCSSLCGANACHSAQSQASRSEEHDRVSCMCQVARAIPATPTWRRHPLLHFPFHHYHGFLVVVPIRSHHRHVGCSWLCRVKELAECTCCREFICASTKDQNSDICWRELREPNRGAKPARVHLLLREPRRQ